MIVPYSEIEQYYFSGNLPVISIPAEDDFQFSLSRKGVLLFTEILSPIDDFVYVRLQDIIEPLLFNAIPSEATFIQEDNGIAFSFLVDDEPIQFYVIKANLQQHFFDACNTCIADKNTTAEFLHGNFLTNQPQERLVKYFEPNFLSYFVTEEDCNLVSDAWYYLNARLTKIKTVLAERLDSSTLYSFNVSFETLRKKLDGEIRPVYFEVYIENRDNVVITYQQRLILHNKRSKFENVYLFENQLGGLDTFLLFGAHSVSENHEYEMAAIDGDNLEYDVNYKTVMKQESGFLSYPQAVWLREFFLTPVKFHYLYNAPIRLYLVEKSMESVAHVLNSFNFSFAYPKHLAIDFVQRSVLDGIDESQLTEAPANPDFNDDFNNDFLIYGPLQKHNKYGF